MSDFLSSLVSKSLGVAPIIRPRPVSMFEPWRLAGVLETAPAIDRAETHRSMPKFESDTAARFEQPHRESYDHVDEAPRTPALPVAPQPVLIPAPAISQPMEYDASREPAVDAPIDRSLTALADPAHSSPDVVPVVERIERMIVDRDQADHDHAESGRPAHKRDTRPLSAEAIANNDVTRVSSNVVPVVERIERVIVDRSQADHDHAEPDRPAHERNTRPLSAEVIANNEVTRASSNIVPVVERMERVIVEHERADRMQTAQPGVSQSIGAVPAPHAPDVSRATHRHVTPVVERVERVRDNSDRTQVDRLSTARTAPPTIHVTIGRIEVRAMPPATPVKRAAPPSSIMSLEEYLRSRSGDRR